MRFLTALAALLATSLSASAQDVAGDQQRLVHCLNRFAADLHAEVATAANPTCSPASLSFAMLMLLPGARGDTADEIVEVLHLPRELRGKRLHRAAQQLIQLCGGIDGSCGFGDGIELAIRNDLWTQTGREVVPDYAALLLRSFGAQLQQIDFASDLEGARRTINAHIKKATKSRIPTLIAPGAMSPNTRHVLTNAIWYRGAWRKEFYRPKQAAPFHVDADRTVQAALMHVQADFSYAEDPFWQAVQVPFKDGSIVFELYLPKPGKTLAAAERAMMQDAMRQRQKDHIVQLSMPAFQLQVALGMKRPLQSLGMARAFEEGVADFSGIDPEEPINLDDVLHCTWINLDEHGVEAAAATAMVLEGKAAPISKPIAMRADRPFAFALRDRRTGLLLFVGRVTDPSTAP